MIGNTEQKIARTACDFLLPVPWACENAGAAHAFAPGKGSFRTDWWPRNDVLMRFTRLMHGPFFGRSYRLACHVRAATTYHPSRKAAEVNQANSAKL